MLDIPRVYVEDLLAPMMAALICLVVLIYFTIVRKRIAVNCRLYPCFLVAFIIFLAGRTSQEFSLASLNQITLLVRISFPMLVFDGAERSIVEMKDNRVDLELDGEGVSFTVLEPEGLKLERTGVELKHRNGMVEEAYVETAGKRVVYRISPLK